ncbi:MAG: hypothetical protein K6T61_14060 [Bryobacteraceae bacterium]|nr:hypothetical protein [Bryobacteraceae bacterium]
MGSEPLRSALAAEGLAVEIHDDHFQRDEEDQVWLKAVGQRRWVVLTKDQRLQYRPLEIGALRSSRARVFVLTSGNLRGIEIAEAFVSAIPAMCRMLHRYDGPFVARINRSGKVALWEASR